MTAKAFTSRAGAGLGDARPSALGGDCSYPTREHHHRLDCGKTAVALYVMADGRTLLRCRQHDGEKARATANAMGAKRISLEDAA